MKIPQALTERLDQVKERYHDAALKMALKRRHRRAIPEMPEGDGRFKTLMNHVRFGVLVIPDWMTKIEKSLFDGDDIVAGHGKARRKAAMTTGSTRLSFQGQSKRLRNAPL